MEPRVRASIKHLSTNKTCRVGVHLLIYESARKLFQEHTVSTKCKDVAPGLSIG